MATRRTANSRATRQRCACALAALMAGASCTMNADVKRWSGPDEVGSIVRSDEGALYVQHESPDAVVRVPRAEVRDVDHPGNGMMVAGGIMLGLWGLLMINSNFRHGLADGTSPRGSDAAGGFPVTVLLVVPGSLMFATGAVLFGRSKSAAASFEDARPAPSVAAPQQ